MRADKGERTYCLRREKRLIHQLVSGSNWGCHTEQSRASYSSQKSRATPPQNQGDEGNGEQLMLNDKADDGEKYLLELKQQHLNEKGRGMWNSIRDRYDERFPPEDGQTSETAKLQMKLMRATIHKAQWPNNEVSKVQTQPIQTVQHG